LSQEQERKPQVQEPVSAANQAKFLRGVALHQEGKVAKAEDRLQEILEPEPMSVDALHELGVAALRAQKLERAIDLIGRAIALKPDYAEAYCDHGMALRKLKRPAEAIASYDKAIALKPDFAMALNNRANALLDLKRFAEALMSCDKAIALRPEFVLAHYNRSVALTQLARFEEALLSYDKTIALKPDFAEAHQGRGHALNHLKRFEEAIAAYKKAFALEPTLTGAEGNLLYAKMRICDWSDFGSECARLISSVRNGVANTSPFPLLAILSSSDDQLQCARLWTVNNNAPVGTPSWQGGRYDHNRIRLAYLSADFHAHATAYLMGGLFESHDRSRFELIAISFGPDDNSEMRERLKGAFDKFIDVGNQSDRDVATLIRNLEIDIAVDLKGFTTDSRTGIFALRAAPLQVSYLGYPGTMGAEYIDYIIADSIVIPASNKKYFSENVVYLPNSYQPNDRNRQIGDRAFTRGEAGLTESGFVFCCFNNNYKITPTVFDRWMRMLKQVEGSVLWLYEDNVSATANLRKEAEARKVSPERLVFAKHMSLPDHLARYRLADLFVDTLPVNAHTTASDALWAGLPVLTQIGETFAGRVAGSLLTAIGLPELITSTPIAYEDLAIELATNPEKLTFIRRKLAANQLTTPLFNTKLSTKHIEAAYTAIYERYQAGLAPEDICVLR
jgi:protein O-GlcNAc transferase